MKGVLIGTDFLNLQNELKFLEINTDVDLFTTDEEFLQLNPLFTYLIDNGYTKLVMIYKAKHINSIIVTMFNNMATTNNITFETIVIPNNSITIPSITTEPNTFYLRCAYDVTAIIDDTYCRDKSEMVQLLFESNNESILPKTYVVNPNNTLTYDNLNTLSDNGIHPNLIVKKIIPDFEKMELPAFYKLNNLEELSTFKSTLAPTTLVQDYTFNSSSLIDNKITDVIRTWHVLLEDVETMISLGGHKTCNNLPLDFDTITYNDNKLDSKWRNMYFSNPRFLRNGVFNSYEVIKIVDNIEISTQIDQLEPNDIIKSVTISGLDFNSTLQQTFNWNSSASVSDIITYTTSSVKSISNTNWMGWFSQLHYTIGATEYSSSIGQAEPIVVRDSVDGLIRFKKANEIIIGDNLITAANIEAPITNTEFIWYSGSLLTLDIEPSDVFVAGVDTNDINLSSTAAMIIHNKDCYYCCFGEDTKISTEYGLKDIKDVNIGDLVWSYNFEINEKELKKVTQIVAPMHDNIVHIILSNDTTIILTTDHPLYTNDGTLVSYNPSETNEWYEDGNVGALTIGTKLKTIDGDIEVISIETSNNNIQTYTLFVKDNKNFYANDVLAFDEQKNK